MKKHALRMRTYYFALGLLLLALVLAGPHRAAAQAGDPVALIHARDAAMTRGDLEAALAFYAGDATIRDANPAPGESGVIRGKDQIRAFLANNISFKIRLESFDFKATGDALVFQNRVWVEDPNLVRLKLLPVEGTNTVVIRDGKIQDWLIDVSDEWMARAQAAFAADQGATPGMPRTGGDKPGVGAWALLAGALAALCGLALRRRAMAPRG